MDKIISELCDLVNDSTALLQPATTDRLLWDHPESQDAAKKLLEDEEHRRVIQQIVFAAVRQTVFSLLVSVDERRCFGRDDVLQFALNGRILDSAEMFHDRFMEMLSEQDPSSEAE